VKKEIDYEKVRFFWNRRADKAGKLDPRSITFFCEEPEALDFRDRREKALFDERVPLTGSESLLEVGCGSGRWTSFLASRAGEITAFDFAAELVKFNRAAAGEAEAGNVRFETASVLELDLEKKDFDLAVCFGVSLYFRDEDLVKAYERIRDHLRAGGSLLTKEPLAVGERIEKIDEDNEFLGMRYTCVYRTRSEFEAGVAGAGFEREWSVPVYGKDDALAPDRDGVETWFARWTLLC